MNHGLETERIPIVLVTLQACASNPYMDQYYAGMMAAYGPQPWVCLRSPSNLLVDYQIID